MDPVTDKGVVLFQTGEELHTFTFPSGRVEIVRGLARALWLGIWPAWRGYEIEIED